MAAILAPVADGPPGSEVSTSFTAAATAFGWSSGVKCRPPGIRSSPAPRSAAPHTTRAGNPSVGNRSATS
ncbi:MAG: hypothetical protein L0H64_13240, partial [Pseudonocardia sp.]|nr:hypothetical protein [Pseudonocardia sp.]